MENRNEILKFMIERLSKLLGVDASTLTEETTIASLNLKSVNYSQLTTALEDECDIEVPYMEFKRQAITLGSAADYIVSLINE